MFLSQTYILKTLSEPTRSERTSSTLAKCPKPLQVTAKKGSMLIAENDVNQVTHNSSFFKKAGHPKLIPQQKKEES